MESSFKTEAVTILAQQWNRLHSQSLYMENITINHEDLSGCWKQIQHASCIIEVRPIRLLKQTDDLRVIISKEAVGNSWGILSPILGHRYHQNHPDRNLQPKSKFYHINVFPYAYVPLMFDLDLVSEERRARFRHLGWVECGYFFYRAPFMS